MSNTMIYLSILTMGAVSYLVRALPVTLIRKQITNTFIKSFLFYVPYVTLAVMTFPAIIKATLNPFAGALALIFGIIVAWFSGSLFKVASTCCVIVLLVELILL